MTYLHLTYLIDQILEAEYCGKYVRVECGIKGKIPEEISDEWSYTSSTFYEDGKFHGGCWIATVRTDCQPLGILYIDDEKREFKFSLETPEFSEIVYTGNGQEELQEYYEERKEHLHKLWEKTK